MSEHLKNIIEAFRPLWHRELDTGEILIIVPLMYHVALYVDPEPSGGCADRYCLLNLELAIKAAEEYATTGQMRYWQKWHSRNISVGGQYLYPAGALMKPEYAIGEVDWNIDELRQRYTYP